jgi:hypothetical protein
VLEKKERKTRTGSTITSPVEKRKEERKMRRKTKKRLIEK